MAALVGARLTRLAGCSQHRLPKARQGRRPQPALHRPVRNPVQALAARTHQVLAAVGLEALPLDVPLAHLSDGYKRCVCLGLGLSWGARQRETPRLACRMQDARASHAGAAAPLVAAPHCLCSRALPSARRVALAVQLVRRPRLLLLDEPLAGARGGANQLVGACHWLVCRLAGGEVTCKGAAKRPGPSSCMCRRPRPSPHPVGLDWRTRHELIGLLEKLKAECTMLVVSVPPMVAIVERAPGSQTGSTGGRAGRTWTPAA